MTTTLTVKSTCGCSWLVSIQADPRYIVDAVTKATQKLCGSCTIYALYTTGKAA